MNINPIVNLAHSVLDTKTSILRHGNNKFLFDYLLPSHYNDNVIYFKTSDITQNYYYDIFFTDDILLQDPIHASISESQIKTIIGIHHKPPTFFKKEDLILHYRSTKNIPKICFGLNLAKDWNCSQDSNVYTVEYGVPNFYNDTDILNRNTSVLVMNLEDNPNIDNLYNAIQQSIPNSLMIKSLKQNTRLSDIITILKQSKIVIDINSSINVLCAVSCGCQCITSVGDINNSLVVSLNDYSQIIAIINDMLSVNIDEKYRKVGAQQISNKYPYEVFVQKINKIFKTYKQEAYIL